MKTIVFKELREGAKMAMLALAVLTFLLTVSYRQYGAELQRGYGAVPPLGQAMTQAGFFCAIFGTVLGWLQIRAEKHRDLWAFLVHRPMTRTAILVSKSLAGLCLYTFGAGLPLLGFIILLWTPGHVAAPFEWAMTRPLSVMFLLGIVFYLAGMLVAVRQARWHGSRGLGFGLALVAAMGVFVGHEFWQTLLILTMTGGILLLAVWGGFESGGNYRNQSLPGKVGLTLACTAGTALLLLLFIGLSETLVPSSSGPSYSEYRFTTNGVVIKVIHHGVEPPKIVDLNGKPIINDKTGRLLTEGDLSPEENTPPARISPIFSPLDERSRPYSYLNPYRYYCPWQVAGKKIWYFTPDGSLVAYDIVTRRQTAILEAPAKLHKFSHGPGGFIPPSHSYDSRITAPWQLVASTKTLYLVDLEKRALKPIWSVPDDETIVGYWGYATIAGSLRALVVTRTVVKMLDLEGQEVWSVPYPPSFSAYAGISCLVLKPSGRFAVIFYPDPKADAGSGGNLPSRIEWITSGEGVTASTDLPPLPPAVQESPLLSLESLILPPALSAVAAKWKPLQWPWNSACLLPAGLCAITGWWLGRRSSFSRKSQVGWAVFHLLFGFAGLLAFLGVQEWPAREECPGCKKLRVVDRAQCPHCGAGFPPPEKNGTEIFELSSAN